MTIWFLAEAEAEFVAAAVWYEEREPGLGKRFREEVAHVIKRIAEDPLLWRERAGGYRRVNCPVFPYYVSYIMRDQTVLVTAVAHGRRHPNFWKDRLGKSK